MPKIPKGVFKKMFANPNVRFASNYLVVEDLSQTPYAMSALEVLQICHSQWDALLEALGSMESASLMSEFNLSDVKPCLPYHVSFSIDVFHGEKTIEWIVKDEGVSTCVMYISCWKDLGSPELISSNYLLTSFDEISFCPHGILPSF